MIRKIEPANKIGVGVFLELYPIRYKTRNTTEKFNNILQEESKKPLEELENLARGEKCN